MIFHESKYDSYKILPLHQWRDKIPLQNWKIYNNFSNTFLLNNDFSCKQCIYGSYLTLSQYLSLHWRCSNGYIKLN